MNLAPLTPEQRARLHRKAELWIKLHPNQSSCLNPICALVMLCKEENLSLITVEDLIKAGYWFDDLAFDQPHCFYWMKED